MVINIWLNKNEHITSLLDKYVVFIDSYSCTYNHGKDTKRSEELFGVTNLSTYNKVITLVITNNSIQTAEFLKKKLIKNGKKIVSFYHPALEVTEQSYCLRSMVLQQSLMGATND